VLADRHVAVRPLVPLKRDAQRPGLFRVAVLDQHGLLQLDRIVDDGVEHPGHVVRVQAHLAPTLDQTHQQILFTPLIADGPAVAGLRLRYLAREVTSPGKQIDDRGIDGRNLLAQPRQRCRGRRGGGGHLARSR
jgi:hypothetical protein